MMTEYSEIVSGRISRKSKILMDKYGFTVRDAIEWFIIAKGNSKKNLEFQKTILQEEILQLKLELISKEMELEEVEKILRENDG